MQRIISLLFICAFAGTALHAQTQRSVVPSGPAAGHKLIWILGPDGRLSAYGANGFHLRASVPPLPPDARERPVNISVSRAGLLLYANQAPNSDRPLRWNLWEHGRARGLLGATRDTRPAKDGSTLETRDTPVAQFSADGQRLFWFENRMSVVQQEGRGDVSEFGEFLAQTSSLESRNLKPLVSIPLPSCDCGTGACEETCPIISAWAPEAGVSDFFFLTRWVPGQTSPDFLETDLYQEAQGEWKPLKLREAVAVEGFLDATGRGNSYIAAVPDAGCCGWENESDNVTYVVAEGKRSVLFDEFVRFHNQNYDISFFTSKALFSPGASRIAYAIAATARLGQEIRLADQGKENPVELKQIREQLAALPRVEVVSRTEPSKPLFSLPNTALVGWLDANRLLVLRQGQLFTVDANNGLSQATGLKVESGARIFIR